MSLTILALSLSAIGALALLGARWRWPDPESPQRVNLRLIGIAVWVITLAFLSPLLSVLPVALVIGGLLYAWREQLQMSLPRLSMPSWGPLAALTILLWAALSRLLGSPLPHAWAAVFGYTALALWIARRQRRAVWVLGLAPFTAFPLALLWAYGLLHAPRGDRRAAAVCLGAVTLAALV